MNGILAASKLCPELVHEFALSRAELEFLAHVILRSPQAVILEIRVAEPNHLKGQGRNTIKKTCYLVLFPDLDSRITVLRMMSREEFCTLGPDLIITPVRKIATEKNRHEGSVLVETALDSVVQLLLAWFEEQFLQVTLPCRRKTTRLDLIPSQPTPDQTLLKALWNTTDFPIHTPIGYRYGAWDVDRVDGQIQACSLGPKNLTKQRNRLFWTKMAQEFRLEAVNTATWHL